MNQDKQDATILALHEAGHASRQIEAILGNIDHATVCRRLKHLTPRKTTEIYKTLRADIFAEKQRKLLMTSDKLSAKEQRDLMTCVGILFDKERLERGQSTGNIGVGVALSPALQESIDKIIQRKAPVDNSQNNDPVLPPLIESST